MKLSPLIAISPILFILSGCAATNSYQEPQATNQAVAVINTENESLGSSMINGLALIPNTSININAVDGHPLPFSFSHESANVTPGSHRVNIGCYLDGKMFGETSFNINARPGKVYTVFNPNKTSGYSVDLNACKKLMIK